MESRIYCIFQTIRRTPPILEENGGASYSLNVAYLSHCGEGEGGEWWWRRVTGGRSGTTFFAQIFFSYFHSLKPRCTLWSGVSYSLKNTVTKMA